MRISRVIPLKEGSQLRCWGVATRAMWDVCVCKHRLEVIGSFRAVGAEEARRSAEAMVVFG